jgi:hypothetical protein
MKRAIIFALVLLAALAPVAGPAFAATDTHAGEQEAP